MESRGGTAPEARSRVLKLLAAMPLALAACEGARPPALEARPSCELSAEALQAGDTIGIRCTGLGSGTYSVRLAHADSAGAPPLYETRLDRESPSARWTIPAGFAAGRVAVSIRTSGGYRSFETFFRVTDADTLVTFELVRDDRDGHRVFLLNGGMSAEYAFEKSLAGYDHGISHSWASSSDGGPRPVMSTPGFLRRSLRQVVRIADETLGAESQIDAVIISPGLPSVPYIARALKAVVLPIHFLVSVDSVLEVDTMLRTAERQGYVAYATLGHDTSMPHAVAWVKLLDVPDEYLAFIRRHRVKDIVLIGSTGVTGGETKARKVLADLPGRYHPRSIYILYPGTSPDDEATLHAEILDLAATPLGSFEYITDWESGISSAQIDRFRSTIRARSSASLTAITSPSLTDLYELGTFTTAAFYRRNPTILSRYGGSPRGVALNPYLMAYPLYESTLGFLPFAYWQGNPPSSIASQMDALIERVLETYYPDSEPTELTIWLNSSRNFGGFVAPGIKASLSEAGYSNFLENDLTVDESWNVPDGRFSASERVFEAISDDFTPDQLARWNAALQPLTVDELRHAAAATSDRVVAE